MLTRVAIFEGVIEKGGEDAFFADVRARLEPIWRRFPHVLDVRVLRTHEADLGARTIHALADWQGKRDDAKTLEQPGKILHELRDGEMAHLHEVQQTPSYAAVDSTLLFLIAITRHVCWTGDMALLTELRPNVDAALGWLRRQLDEGGGYVTYDGLAGGKQPINQSWRDSGTGVLRRDGGYPVPPLALVELQGYAFQATWMMARLLCRAGDGGHANRLDATAAELRDRFLRDFWMEDEGCHCLALEAGGRQVTSVTSNAAQVLWTGIATPDHAARIAARVMRPGMFSGWGMRTLSADHAAFDPLACQQACCSSASGSPAISGRRAKARAGLRSPLIFKSHRTFR